VSKKPKERPKRNVYASFFQKNLDISQINSTFATEKIRDL
jgi:hypothetical protein